MSESSTHLDPDRGFGKFFVNWEMIAKYYPCMWWEMRVPKQDLLLTKEAVRNLLSLQPAPVWWILERLRTKYVDRYPQEFFDDLWTTLHRKSDALYAGGVRDKEYEMSMAQTLLNYLYDNNHNGARDYIELRTKTIVRK